MDRLVSVPFLIRDLEISLSKSVIASSNYKAQSKNSTNYD